MSNGIFHRRFIFITLIIAVAGVAAVRGMVSEQSGVNGNIFRNVGMTSSFERVTN